MVNFTDLMREVFNRVLRFRVEKMNLDSKTQEIVIEFSGYKIIVGILDFEEKYYMMVQCEDAEDDLYNYIYEHIGLKQFVSMLDSLIMRICMQGGLN